MTLKNVVKIKKPHYENNFPFLLLIVNSNEEHYYIRMKRENFSNHPEIISLFQSAFKNSSTGHTMIS